MEEKTETSVNNGQITGKDPKTGQFLPGNKLGGKKPGSLDFKTKFEMFLDKLAKKNDMTPQEIDEQLFAVAYKKAKEGDYQFWRDVHDRVYGKPLQKSETDVTSGGKPIIIDHELIAKNATNIIPKTDSEGHS